MTDAVVLFTPQTTENGNKGILASELYKALHARSKDFSRWAERNIVQNQYIVKNKDWLEVAEMSKTADGGTRNPHLTQRRKKNYILSLDSAKKIVLSKKTPKQQEIIDSIVKLSNVQTKKPMIPVSQVANMVQKMVMETLARQNGRLQNYDALLLENKQKDDAIKSLQLSTQAKKGVMDSQATIRQIVCLVAKETPYYAQKKDAHQILYNMVMSDFFKLHPVKWKAEWYALKNKEYAKQEFARIQIETGEKPESKLDWIRLTHPNAMIDILDCARNMAVSNLPYTFFTNGGTLPA